MAERTPSSTNSYASSGGFDSAPSGGTDSYSGGGGDDDGGGGGGGYSGGDDDDDGGGGGPRTVTETTRVPSATASYARAGGFEDAPSGGTDSYDGGGDSGASRPSYEQVTAAVDRVTQPTAAGAAAVDLDRQVESVDVGRSDVVATDSGYRLDDTTTAEVARQQAAADAPLREPDDFVADTSGEEVSVRRRARPFFEDQREALGLNPPEESGIRRRLRGASASIQGTVDGLAERQASAGVGDVGQFIEDSSIPGSDALPTVTGADQTRGAGAVADIPGAIDSAFRAGERAANVGQASVESTAAEAGLDDDLGLDRDAFDTEVEAQQAAVGQTASDLGSVARTDPGTLVGAIGAGTATSVGIGVGLGRGVTSARDAVRTAGAREIDFSDVTNPSTRSFIEGDGGDPFPPVRDQDLAADAPAEAIRRQADEFTPEELETEFDEAGAAVGPDESVMFRAVDTEPEGPGVSRADQGLETFGTERPFDPPGGFVSPELSPRFLGVEDAEFSPRPGLPDFGGRPTAVAVRTEVREPDASDFEGFRRELDERAGETDAFTNPDFSLGEAEAVIPPQAEFAPVSSGGAGRRAARALGIGSDFEINVGGRSVPLRTVADVEGRRGFVADDRGSLGAGRAAGQSRRLDEFSSRRARQRTDRPTGVAGSSGLSSPSSSAFGGTSGVALGSSSGLGGSSAGGSSGGSSGGTSGTTSSPSSGTSGLDAGAFAGGGSSTGTVGGSGFGGSSGTDSSSTPTSGVGGGGGFGTPTTTTGGGTGFGDGFDTPTEPPTRGGEELPEDDVDLEDEGDVLLGEQDDLFDSGIAEAEDILNPGSN
jgi:hypothetical protein